MEIRLAVFLIIKIRSSAIKRVVEIRKEVIKSKNTTRVMVVKAIRHAIISRQIRKRERPGKRRTARSRFHSRKETSLRKPIILRS